jgi:hypothetical protein
MLPYRKVCFGLLPMAVLLGLAVAPASADSVVTEDDAKWLLGNAEVIVKVNVKQLMASQLMKKEGVEDIKKAINSNEQVKALLDAAGLDVTKDFDSILISGAASSPKEANVRVVVRGNFDPDKIQSALKKRDEVKVSKEGATTLFEVPVQDKAMFGAFADKNTLVLTQNKDATVEAVKSGGKAPAAMSKEMKSALGRFTGKESMAMALVINDELKKMIAGAPRFGEAAAKLQTLTTALTISDKVDFAVRGITGEAKSANQLSKLLEAVKATAAAAAGDLPPGVEDILNAVKISADKEAVKVDLQLTKEMLDKAGKK